MNLIESVWFDNNELFVKINGRTYVNPVNKYPNLSKGNSTQLASYTIEGSGKWIHWEELDEDLSADGFVNDK